MNFDLTPDQQQLQARVRDFAQAEVAPVAETLDRDGVFPAALYRQLGDLGVMSIPFDEKYGGMGLGVFEAVLALEEIARADQSLAVSAMVSMATGLTLARFGRQPLIDRWLPEIVTGQKMCAIAGTEPNAGSDTAGFKTRARMVGNDRWSISGEKAPASADPSGGASAPRSFSFRRPKVVGVLRGTVIGGGSRGVVQVFRGGRWSDVGAVTARRGRYHFAAPAHGTYRVVFAGATGPSVRL